MKFGLGVPLRLRTPKFGLQILAANPDCERQLAWQLATVDRNVAGVDPNSSATCIRISIELKALDLFIASEVRAERRERLCRLKRLGAEGIKQEESLRGRLGRQRAVFGGRFPCSSVS